MRGNRVRETGVGLHEDARLSACGLCAAVITGVERSSWTILSSSEVAWFCFIVIRESESVCLILTATQDLEKTVYLGVCFWNTWTTC